MSLNMWDGKSTVRSSRGGAGGAHVLSQEPVAAEGPPVPAPRAPACAACAACFGPGPGDGPGFVRSVSAAGREKQFPFSLRHSSTATEKVFYSECVGVHSVADYVASVLK